MINECRFSSTLNYFQHLFNQCPRLNVAPLSEMFLVLSFDSYKIVV